MATLRIALLCGGPSPERGISLNSARSVLDHLGSEEVALCPVYYDWSGRPWSLAAANLYSNTPADFDHKVASIGEPLDGEKLRDFLLSCDLTMPVIHGAFGEGGDLQAQLEEWGIPFVGSPASACREAFDKLRARNALREWGWPTWPGTRVGEVEEVQRFMEAHPAERYVVKPTQGGSSVGVSFVSTAPEAVTAAEALSSEALLEPVMDGREFTLVVLQNEKAEPVPLVPTEIRFEHGRERFFSYRRKYLPTDEIRYRNPPDFPAATVDQIRREAGELFRRFGFRDVVRLDGWVRPDGCLLFTDCNIASGMEQNSFLFQQAAQAGWSHRAVVQGIVARALARSGKAMAPLVSTPPSERKPLAVLFGGESSERQVSLMSGTNVWLKLRGSREWAPEPWLLDPEGRVWPVPYPLALRHTTEEILAEMDETGEASPEQERWLNEIAQAFTEDSRDLPREGGPSGPLPLEEFLEQTETVFLALHGGMGEDGTLQAMLEAKGRVFSGSGAEAARLCMDKARTAERIEAAQPGAGILTLPKRIVKAPYRPEQAAALYDMAIEELNCDLVVMKPVGDGCSSGVAVVSKAEEVAAYLRALANGDSFLAEGTLSHQSSRLEMPSRMPPRILLEPYFVTDRVQQQDGALVLTGSTGWVEVTIGLLEEEGRLRVLPPSLTVAEGEILNLEEKFQGGTGVNLTPPPPEWVSPAAIEQAQEHAVRVAEILGVLGFARLDAFLERESGHLCVIEMNTTPGLTPSTVIYQQALALTPPCSPRAFLESILRAAEARHQPVPSHER